MKAAAPTAREYVEGVLAGNRTLLARAVTLIESQHPKHQQKAREVLRGVLPHTGKSWRVGITGTPGAGKSTLIEALGMFLIEQGHRVAVLAVDPSSSLTRGSILGDKTRMEQLSRSPQAFIRPSPAGGTLGGVAQKSRETLMLCEAAGYDIVLVETVGVGQSETHVRDMVDCFALLTLTGSGDELQGIKKGVMEMIDLLAVNKADGDNTSQAAAGLRSLHMTLHYLNAFTPQWEIRSQLLSAFEPDMIAKFWQNVTDFFAHLEQHSLLQARRATQREVWLRQLLETAVLQRFYEQDAVSALYPRLLAQVKAGDVWAMDAVETLLGVDRPVDRHVDREGFPGA